MAAKAKTVLHDSLQMFIKCNGVVKKKAFMLASFCRGPSVTTLLWVQTTQSSRKGPLEKITSEKYSKKILYPKNYLTVKWALTASTHSPVPTH